MIEATGLLAASGIIAVVTYTFRPLDPDLTLMSGTWTLGEFDSAALVAIAAILGGAGISRIIRR